MLNYKQGDHLRDKYDASPSALGYLYQIRYSMLALYNAGPGAKMLIEALDDLSLDDGKSKSLIQLKHSKDIKIDLTNSSSKLWKT